MFCINCGQQMPEGTKFCGGCGTNVAQGTESNLGGAGAVNTFDIKETFNEICTEVVSLIKNPIDTVKAVKSKNKNTYMIFGVVAALLAVLNVYIFSSAFVKTIAGTFADSGMKMMLEGRNFGIIMRLLINNIAILAIVAGVIFIIFNVIMKKSDFSYFDGLKVLIAGYAYSSMLVFVGAIVSYIYLPLGLCIIAISIISYMVLVYEGINSFELVDKSKCLYIVLIIMATIIISQYMIISMQITKAFGSFGMDGMDILEEMFY